MGVAGMKASVKRKKGGFFAVKKKTGSGPPQIILPPVMPPTGKFSASSQRLPDQCSPVLEQYDRRCGANNFSDNSGNYITSTSFLHYM